MNGTPDGAVTLVVPLLLAAGLAGIGVYGVLARRNAVLVLVGAELLLNAANILLVAASALPSGGLAALRRDGTDPVALPGVATAGDPLLGGQTMAIFVITIAAAEIGLALAIVLLLFRARSTSDLAAVRELGEASPTFTETPGVVTPAEPAPASTAQRPIPTPTGAVP